MIAIQHNPANVSHFGLEICKEQASHGVDMFLFYFFQGCKATGECIKSLCVLDRTSEILLCLAAAISLSVVYSLKLLHRQPTVADNF